VSKILCTANYISSIMYLGLVKWSLLVLLHVDYFLHIVSRGGSLRFERFQADLWALPLLRMTIVVEILVVLDGLIMGLGRRVHCNTTLASRILRPVV
jgi:hypothetical protein